MNATKSQSILPLATRLGLGLRIHRLKATIQFEKAAAFPRWKLRFFLAELVENQQIGPFGQRPITPDADSDKGSVSSRHPLDALPRSDKIKISSPLQRSFKYMSHLRRPCRCLFD